MKAFVWILPLLLQGLCSHAARMLLTRDLGVHSEVIAGAEVLWQQPQTVRGVLLVTHAGQRNNTDFFPKSDTCPECRGYPEETNITQVVLQHGYVVLAVQSGDHTWAGTPEFKPEDPSDVIRVIAMLDILRAREGWEDVPVYGFGICSGYTFLSVFTLAYPLKAIVGQLSTLATTEPACTWSYKCALLMGKWPETVMEPIPKPVRQRLLGYPPIMAILTARDKWTLDRAVGWHVHLEATLGLKVNMVELQPSKVDAQLLRRKLPKLSAASAADLMERFLEHKMVDAEGYTLMPKDHPPSSCENHLPQDWTWGLDPEPEKWQPGDSVYTAEGVGIHQITEVLKGAHACHEADSHTIGDALQWLEQANTAPALASA